MTLPSFNTVARAELSGGISLDPIYSMIRRVLEARQNGGGTVVDVGCGTGQLHSAIGGLFERYLGCDVVEYPGLPKAVEFFKVDLETGRLPLASGSADVLVAAETIEHLEKPRALVREMARVVRPGGLVIVTTPNNLSFLSKLTLIVKNQFNAFQDGSYPAHITALLEVDLLRMARENRLVDVRVEYSRQGRMPGTARSFPGVLSRWFPRAFSDNVMLCARRPT